MNIQNFQLLPIFLCLDNFSSDAVSDVHFHQIRSHLLLAKSIFFSTQETPLVTSRNDLVTITNIDDDGSSNGEESRKSGSPTIVYSYEAFISRTWTLVVLAVAIAGTCAALWMFIYVLIKMCDKTLTGNQTMGLILLIGVTALFASVVPWLLPPNEMICMLRHFLHPFIMVLCFAILLVKVFIFTLCNKLTACP